MIAAVRIRGRVDVSHDIEETLIRLRLKKPNWCSCWQESKSIIGMLRKAKDWLTWGPIKKKVLSKLLSKRGRLEGNIRLLKGFIKIKGYNDFESLADQLLKKKVKFKDLGIKPFFRLSPPSKGFKRSTTGSWPKGAFGDRGSKINDLLKKMI